ncbi:hypothetical protein COT49_02235 [candidate division WWE3 bacterium CG08_land_8_20_14_0_20_40_13]|uniref:Uncharacterized protein n=1 Tax=candidate division WWE3 bacterium CG08_land_8_20_14_0_20_40_13 TaxID=1975084 RepID=A0A2H0XFY9_UNCKA|nr:MAG: hypothetical protein COT49_02235 [candidate division WWE3 bacterium CG08_land_8_20_14_0_20_40_13]
MIKHIWSVLCQRSVVDSQSNNVSLIDVFEQLQVGISPFDSSDTSVSEGISIPVQYELVNFWSKTNEVVEEKGSIRIVLLDPKGKEIKRMDKDLIIPQTNRRMREINKIQGISLKGNGIYNFVVSIKQEDSDLYITVAEIPLEVKIGEDTKQG